MMDISGIGIVAAFLAGAISFLSPCVLPLVPGYVSYIAGQPDLRTTRSVGLRARAVARRAQPWARCASPSPRCGRTYAEGRATFGDVQPSDVAPCGAALGRRR